MGGTGAESGNGSGTGNESGTGPAVRSETGTEKGARAAGESKSVAVGLGVPVFGAGNSKIGSSRGADLGSVLDSDEAKAKIFISPQKEGLAAELGEILDSEGARAKIFRNNHQQNDDGEKKGRNNNSGRSLTSVVSSIMRCAATVWLPVGLATFKLCNGDVGIAEDYLDLLHAVYTTTSSARLVRHFTDTQYNEKLTFNTLRTDLASDCDRFVTVSTSFFCADLLHIFHQLAVKRNFRLHQWRERIAHHVLQAVANIPVLQTNKNTPQGAAMRTYLTQAYLAEGSDLFLRLHNLMKAWGWLYLIKNSAFGGASSASRRRLVTVKGNYIMLLVAFFVCRIVNFGLCVPKVASAMHVMPRSTARLHAWGAGLAYLLSFVWFVKLVGIWRRKVAPL
mmetsp:Transcript_8597/g.15888  ORF Transcript_8597/g.15888 Transcript_8597/m.15888 type:complete len:393 (-) Transcript_8597:48-1226(-)